ncbi:MAG: NAD(P)H-dependent oxidoreductase [Dehalococcoidia bacterium]
MKIAVLNGSPKGEISVTVQYIKFIQKKFPRHELKLINVAHDIIKIEKNDDLFKSIIDEVRKSDAVIWAFPLYVFLVCSQYKRFIELIWENGAQDAFRGKYAGVLSTSIHFFDHTAHNYMRGICDDLEMKSIEYFSADMDDIFIDEKRDILLKWAGDFFAAVENNAAAARANAPLIKSKFSYRPGKGLGKVDPRGLKIRVLADIDDEKSNIAGMVRRYAGAFSGDIEVLKLQDIDIKGGCLGCMQCAFDNICVYQGKDSYVDTFNRTMRDSDVTIFAGTVRDRFFSARVKMFWDRAFFNGHVPTHIGQQVGFIVSGPLAQLPNMQQVLQANAEMSEANYAGVVTDECGDSAILDTLIDGFASRCADYARSKFIRPKTFLGVGGHKIFRDSIWARLSFPFTADYRYYEEHGLFDFPQQDARYLEFSKQMTEMIKDPKMKEMVRKMMKTEMLKGYAKMVETK